MTRYISRRLAKRIIGILVISGLISTPTWAQSAPTEIDAIYACKSLTSDAARLACFDQAVGRLQQAQEQGQLVTISKEEVETVEREAFGFSIPSLSGLGAIFKSDSAETTDQKAERIVKEKLGTAGLDSITSNVTQVAKFGNNKVRMLLENGHVWEQTDGTKIRSLLRRDPAGLSVTIKRGALGSHLLQVNAKGPQMSVRRVR